VAYLRAVVWPWGLGTDSAGCEERNGTGRGHVGSSLMDFVDPRQLACMTTTSKIQRWMDGCSGPPAACSAGACHPIQ
jgi:hypothetical protein